MGIDEGRTDRQRAELKGLMRPRPLIVLLKVAVTAQFWILWSRFGVRDGMPLSWWLTALARTEAARLAYSL